MGRERPRHSVSCCSREGSSGLNRDAIRRSIASSVATLVSVNDAPIANGELDRTGNTAAPGAAQRADA